MSRFAFRSVLGAAAVGLVLLSGCGAEPVRAAAPSETPAGISAGPAPASEPASEPAPAPAPEVQAVRLSYAGGEVVGGVQRIPVALGSRAELVVSGDAADELHLHGYDIRQPVPAGGSGTIAFTADVPGVFELELHDSGALLAQVEVS